jgi:hypothetical protein
MMASPPKGIIFFASVVLTGILYDYVQGFIESVLSINAKSRLFKDKI